MFPFWSVIILNSTCLAGSKNAYFKTWEDYILPVCFLASVMWCSGDNRWQRDPWLYVGSDPVWRPDIPYIYIYVFTVGGKRWYLASNSRSAQNANTLPQDQLVSLYGSRVKSQFLASMGNSGSCGWTEYNLTWIKLPVIFVAWDNWHWADLTKWNIKCSTVSI
jgi:hypothetical protein